MHEAWIKFFRFQRFACSLSLLERAGGEVIISFWHKFCIGCFYKNLSDATF